MKSNPIVKWAVISFIYAFVPMSFMAFGDNSGEAGPGRILLFPPFWPVAFTFFGIITILTFFAQFSATLLNLGSSLLMMPLLIILNLIAWTFIGALIGWIIQKRRIKNEK